MSENRPKSECISEIKSYYGKVLTPERIMDLHMLSQELGDDYEVKWWTFGKHIRVVVLFGGRML